MIEQYSVGSSGDGRENLKALSASLRKDSDGPASAEEERVTLN
jgi:hypothetical protein